LLHERLAHRVNLCAIKLAENPKLDEDTQR
jgi:hypothetical protein